MSRHPADERLRWLAFIIALVFVEVYRRLKELNGAHEKAVEVQHTYVTQEKFDDQVRATDRNATVVAKALTLAEGASKGRGALVTIIVGAASFLLVVISIIIVVGDILTP